MMARRERGFPSCALTVYFTAQGKIAFNGQEWRANQHKIERPVKRL